MSDPLRAFVNAAPVAVPRGATALDAVRAWKPAEADAVAAGARAITDSRGLPLDPAAPLQAGAILRTVPNRGPDAADPALRDEFA
ncbi:MAG: hypothetical protein KGL38_14885 [Gemmatimonadota bacterium]|nr:hypothetical protein [Gemmatimonadota bacterium]MDE3129293.1 hypothetical protein [Gemmatimonadota bacterium]MDE3171782.1 hypothetical protein [Gemmatimonadota bacterium]MDE3216538.1 hypothetical protein [Gemmatimonadota bacterium]